MSRVQVLVAAIDQTDHSLLEELNLQTDAIVGNQCERNEIENFTWNDHKITYLNLCERGVGLNRNNSLMRATGEICLFADDDMTYVDNYAEIIEKCFEEIPQADVIIFNLLEPTPTRHVIKMKHKVGLLECMRYGTVRIAIKTQKIREQGILFNLCFGGGTEHTWGEDTLFLVECVKHGLKVYAVPVTLLQLRETRASTCFQGYTEKFFRDQGFLYSIVSRRGQRLLCLQDAIRHAKKYGKPWYEVYRLMRSF